MERRKTRGMRLTNEEKETIILFNEADNTATVETFQGKIIRRMEKEGVKPVKEDSYGMKRYIVPKSWVKVYPPRKVVLSDEAKEKARANLAVLHQNRRLQVQEDDTD